MKPFWQSKTLWVNLVMAIAAFFPQVQAHLDGEQMAAGITAVNAIIRMTTKEGIVLK